MFFLKGSLFKQFTTFSSIAFIIIGIVLGVLISNHIKNDRIQNIEELISLTIDTLIKPELSAEDLSKPFSESMRQNLNQKFEQIMISNNFIGINIWNKEGKLVYSINHFVEGKFDNNKNKLMEALRTGKSSYSIIRVDKGEGAEPSKYNEVIKVYRPISYNFSGTSGVFEVYIPYDEVKQHITTLNRLITAIMFSGLLLLYLFLLKIIYNASNTLISQNQSLQEQKEELVEAYAALNASYMNTVAALSKAVDARDPYTAGHSERVTAIALEIGKKLGLSNEFLETLKISALLHDIGKLGVPDNILLKPGKLDELEFQKIKEHPSIGVNILKNVDFLKDVLPIILHHHERYSGGGYPDGISGSDIPLGARIICVADTYDAITSDRPYRKGLSHEEAISEIVRFKGIQFDPDIVDSFLSLNHTLFVHH